MNRSNDLKKFTKLRKLNVDLIKEDLQTVNVAALLVSPTLQQANFAFNGVKRSELEQFLGSQDMSTNYKYVIYVVMDMALDAPGLHEFDRH